ncbi:intermembrane transport protein PqiB [Vibrio vulnificus]|nr:intermembrane transport protein PqiB [Vibrio vulnificus]
MSEEIKHSAKISQQKQLSSVWIIPILALGIGLWMLFQHLNSTGPKIYLKLPTADGLEVGKTQIKALNVNVGVITDIALSENYDHIIATAQMSKDAQRMLREDSLFWVVKPRIGKDGISGLDTLLSGSYLQLQPGHGSQFQDSFTVLDLPPVAPTDAKGLRLKLTHREAGKLSVGDPVIYEGFTVGRVEKTDYDVEQKKAEYQIFVFSPYDRLVTENAHFWLNSGLNFKMNAEGIDVKVPSVETLLKGGVTFGLVDDDFAGMAITESMREFRLFDDIDQIREGMFNDYVEFVMMFDESVRGLKPNAPVEFRGLRIGTVAKVPLRVRGSSENMSSNRIPVLVKIELGRVYNNSTKLDPIELKLRMDKEFSKGLRAVLKTGNLLTGALYIDTDYVQPSEENTWASAHSFDGYPLFPTTTGGFAEVQKQVTDLLKKINSLPIDETVKELNATLATTEKALASANTLLSNQNTQALPEELKETLAQLQQTLAGFSPDSPAYKQLESALNEINLVMQELKPVVQKINEKPNALIFGDGDLVDPVPAKGKQK